MNNENIRFRIDDQEARSQLLGGYDQDQVTVEENVFAEIWAIIRYRTKIFTSIFIIVTTFGISMTMLEVPKYRATALLMISPKQEKIINDSQSLSEVAPDSAFVESELEVLKSPTLVTRLVTELKLTEDPEWNWSLREQSALSALKSAVAKALHIEKVSTTSIDDGGQATAIETNVANTVSGAIGIERRGKSYVIQISAQSESPSMAANLANAVANTYLRAQVEDRFKAADKANEWLMGRLDELKQEVQAKESAAQAYRAENGLLTAQGVSLVESQIADVQGAVVAARAELAEKRARYEQVAILLATGGSIETIAGVLNSGVVRELRGREAEIAQRQAELENQFGPLYPTVEKVRHERKDIQVQIEAEISRIAVNLKNEAEVVEARLKTLEANLRGVRRDLVTNNTELVRLNELETDARAARLVYESFLKRFHEVSQQGNLSPIDARIVSQARIPTTPSSPNLKLSAILSALIGLGLGFLVAFLLERLRGTIRSQEEVGKKLGIAATASIPLLSNKDFKELSPAERYPAGYVLEKPMSEFSEAIRGLRSTFIRNDLRSSGHVIAITSALSAEGKTTIALSLARVAALSGQKVILIDCDVRRRSLSQLLEVTAEKGILEVLDGEVSWSDVIETDENSGVDFISACTTEFTPKDYFGSPIMEAFIDDLSKAYDLVILDCAPVLAVAETLSIVQHVNTVLLACRANYTPVKALIASFQRLHKIGDNFDVGVVLNCVSLPGISLGGVGYYGEKYNLSSYYNA